MRRPPGGHQKWIQMRSFRSRLFTIFPLHKRLVPVYYFPMPFSKPQLSAMVSQNRSLNSGPLRQNSTTPAPRKFERWLLAPFQGRFKAASSLRGVGTFGPEAGCGFFTWLRPIEVEDRAILIAKSLEEDWKRSYEIK